MIEVVRLTDFAQRKLAPVVRRPAARVALARARQLPAALLLDEPLGALDLKLRHVMQFELRFIQREVGITFIYVTHDQEEALMMSDRIAVMNGGHVEQIEIRPRSMTGYQRVRRLAIGQANCGTAGRRGVLNPRLRRTRSAGHNAAGCVGDTTIESGGRATLMVRPERVRVSVQQPPKIRRCHRRGRQGRRSDLPGPVLRLSLAAADGSPILAHIGAEQDLPMLRPGDDVFVSWSPDASLVLPV